MSESGDRSSRAGAIKAGIIGGTGYTGVELLRILVSHPGAEVKLITSRGEAGKRICDFFPSLRGTRRFAFRRAG